MEGGLPTVVQRVNTKSHPTKRMFHRMRTIDAQRLARYGRAMKSKIFALSLILSLTSVALCWVEEAQLSRKDAESLLVLFIAAGVQPDKIEGGGETVDAELIECSRGGAGEFAYSYCRIWGAVAVTDEPELGDEHAEEMIELLKKYGATPEPGYRDEVYTAKSVSCFSHGGSNTVSCELAVQ